MDQELADAAAYAPGDTVCALTWWQLFSLWNYVMAAILKVSRHIRNLTPSFDAYLLENNCAKFHPDPIW